MRENSGFDGVWRVLSTRYTPFIRHTERKPVVSIRPAAFNIDLVPCTVTLNSTATLSQSGGDLSVKSH
jgi:hypothetical protein